jgi:23S rRNA pseudouridine2605 synthase
MRLNKFLAENTNLSRRKADEAIALGFVQINDKQAILGQSVVPSDKVTLNDVEVRPRDEQQLILILNKPIGFVCSRKGQGSKTIYNLLPDKFSNLNPAGRLDKDSSGLLLLTNNGNLINELTHPSKGKKKIYLIEINKPLTANHTDDLKKGVMLSDGLSKLQVDIKSKNHQKLQITIHEGRNRQIRRTFESLGYKVTKLHRISFGEYKIGYLLTGKYIVK